MKICWLLAVSILMVPHSSFAQEPGQPRYKDQVESDLSQAKDDLESYKQVLFRSHPGKTHLTIGDLTNAEKQQFGELAGKVEALEKELSTAPVHPRATDAQIMERNQLKDRAVASLAGRRITVRIPASGAAKAFGTKIYLIPGPNGSMQAALPEELLGKQLPHPMCWIDLSGNWSSLSKTATSYTVTIKEVHHNANMYNAETTGDGITSVGCAFDLDPVSLPHPGKYLVTESEFMSGFGDWVSGPAVATVQPGQAVAKDPR